MEVLTSSPYATGVLRSVGTWTQFSFWIYLLLGGGAEDLDDLHQLVHTTDPMKISSPRSANTTGTPDIWEEEKDVKT